MCAYRRLPRSSRFTQSNFQYIAQQQQQQLQNSDSIATLQSTSMSATIAAGNDEPNSYPPPPKHIPFPDVPSNSDFINEFLIFAYTLLAASMQFLHLYRTVWWLPESYTNQTMVSFPQ